MRATILLAAALMAGAAIAQVKPDAPGMADLMKQDQASRATYAAMPDTPGTGPYPALKQVDPGLSGHVVYRPADLSKLGATKLGILIWGNGGCGDDGASARLHLAEIASHGYLVIAPGVIGSGPGAPPQPPRPAQAVPGPLPVKTTTAQVMAGLDWALAENKRAGSPYFDKIDTNQIAVSGHSCGGLQAIQAAADPRIHAVIIHNSGVFADGTNPIKGIDVDKSLLTKLHTPILYILGGPTDVAFPNGTDDYRLIDRVPAVLVNLPVGHGGTFREPNGGRIAQVDVAWLAWQLRHDAKAGAMFTGADCGLCRGPDWKIERKGL